MKMSIHSDTVTKLLYHQSSEHSHFAVHVPWLECVIKYDEW